MIKNVVDNKGNHLGYLVDIFFISKKFEKFISNKWGSYSSVKAERVCKSVIRVDNECYNCIMFPFDIRNYKFFIECCKLNNLVLNDILFMPIVFKDIDYSLLSEIWKTRKVCGRANIHKLACIDTSTSSIIGYLMSGDVLFNCEAYYINMLEVVEKSKGFGTRIVTQLKSFNIKLVGLSLKPVQGFWLKLGAEFDEVSRFNINI